MPGVITIRVRNLNPLVSAGVLLATTRPVPALTKGDIPCQVFPPVTLNWRMPSAITALCLTGPVTAVAMGLLGSMISRSRSAQGGGARERRCPRPEKSGAAPGGGPRVRCRAEAPAVTVKVTAGQADELAV